MFPFNFINAIPPDIAIRIQFGAAAAIYTAIVFSAIALALLITYESVVDRGGRRHDAKEVIQDRSLGRAA
jgi:hypothetical protein